MRLFQRAYLPFAAIGLGAEQLHLHAFRRDGGGAHGHERPVLAGRQGMDGTRRQFLARARRADHHHAAVGRRHSLDRLAKLAHGGRHADKVEGFAAALLQVRKLAAKLRRLQRALGDEDQPVRLERLFDEIVCATPDGRDRRLDGSVAGDHHDGQVRMQLLDLVQKCQPVQARSLQPDVEEDETRHPVGDRSQSAVGVVGRARLVAFVVEDAGDQFANVLLIVNDQNVRRHFQPFRSSCRPPRLPQAARCGSWPPGLRGRFRGRRAVRVAHHGLPRSS